MTNLKIRLANSDEFNDVLDFYYDLIDAMADMEYHPKWKKEIYPSRDIIMDALEGEVSADCQEAGIGKAMVGFVLDKAAGEGGAAVRVDVIKGNVPAENLYESLGFEYIDEIELYYEDTGYTDFLLYEYLI